MEPDSEFDRDLDAAFEDRSISRAARHGYRTVAGILRDWWEIEDDMERAMGHPNSWLRSARTYTKKTIDDFHKQRQTH